MKFTYDKKTDDRECVAYIDGLGVLYIKTDEGSTLLYESETPNHNGYFNPTDATHRFYAGDSVTITF